MMDSPNNPFAESFDETVDGKHGTVDGDGNDGNGGGNNSGGIFDPFADLFPVMPQNVPPPLPSVPQQQQQQQQQQEDLQLQSLEVSPPPLTPFDVNKNVSTAQDYNGETTISASPQQAQDESDTTASVPISISSPQNIEHSNPFSMQQTVSAGNIGSGKPQLGTSRNDDKNEHENAVESNSDGFAGLHPNESMPMEQQHHELPEHQQQLELPIGQPALSLQPKDYLMQQEQPQPSNENENAGENGLFSSVLLGSSTKTGDNPFSATIPTDTSSTGVASTSTTPDETSADTDGGLFNESVHNNEMKETTEQKVPIVQDEVETSYNRENSGDRRIDYTPYGAFADGELESDDIDNTTVANNMGTSTMGQSNKNPFDKAMNNYGEGDSNEGALALSANDRSLNNIASHNGSYNSNTNTIEDSSQRLAAMRSNHSSSFTTYTEGESWKSDDDDNSSSSRSSSDVEECQEIMKTDEEFLLRRSKGDDFNASSRGRSLTPRKSIHIDDSTDDEGDDDGATNSRSNESEEVETRLRYASVAAAKRGSYPEEEEDKQVEQVDQRVAAGGDDSGSDTTSSRGMQSSEGIFFTKRFKGGVEEDDLVSVTFGQEQSHDADKNLKDDKDSPIKPGFNSDSAARHSTMSQEELDTFLHPLMDFEDDYSDTRLRDAASDGMVNGISTGNDEESAFTGAPSVQAPQQNQHGQQNNKTSSSPKRKKKRKDDSQKAFYIIMIVSITAAALCLGAFIYFWFLPYLDKLEAKKKANNNVWQPPSMSPPKSPDAQVIATPILNESAPCAYFTMSLLTDAYGNETTWELHYYGDAVVGNNTTGSRVAFDSRAVHDSDASLSMSYFAPKVDSKRIRRHIHKQRKSQEIREPAIIATGGPYDYVDTKSPSYDPESSGRHIASMCLPEGSYKFLLKDVNGDGICCDYGLGSYGLYFNGGRDVRPTSLAEFFVKEETLFQVTEEDVVLANTSTSPSVSLAPTSTDHPSSVPSTTPTYIPDSLLSMQTVRSINTLSGISKSHGLLFDIETNSNISSLNVVSMELLIDSQGPIEYEIWTMKGSRHELDLTDPNFFTAFYKVSEGILNASGVCETCGFSSIPLDQFQDVLIEGWRTRQAFWISLKQNTLVFQEYENQKESHNLQVISQVATPEFEIYYGTAVLFEPINMVNPKLDFRGVMGFLGKIWYQANFMNESSVNASSPSTPAYENNATTLNSNSSSNFPETNPSNSSIPTEVYSGDSSINDTLSYQSNVTNGTQPSNFSSHTPESDQSNSSLPTDIITGAYTPIPTSFPTLNPTLTPHLNGSSVPNILPSLSPNISSELNASSISHDNSTNDSVPPQGTTQLMTDLSYPYIFSSTFQGNLAPSRFGSSVAISKDGKILAIGAMGAINGLGTPSGAVYIYEIDSDGVNGTSQTWLQTIFGESSGEEFGCAVSISQFGNEIVVGSRSEMGLTGAMRVFRRTNNTWAIQGDPIFGFSEGGQAGWSVAISGDGQIVAMGIPKGGANGGGSVTAFKFGIDEINYDMAWIPYGNPVEGLVNGEETGYSIALSQDGGILAVGSPKTSSPLGIMFAGKVSVNRYNGSDWVVVGQEMFGESPDDNHGTSVALSQDGAVLLVGSKGKDVNGTENVGQCSLYDLTESSFGSSTYSLLGESPEEHLGSFVALSSDASIVACGGVNGNFDGSSISGVVRVFNRNTQQESTVWPKTDVLSSWDAALFGSSIAVPSTGHYLVIGAPGWSDGSEGSTNGSLQIFEDSA